MLQVRSAILQSGDEVRFLPEYVEDAAHRTNQQVLVYPWVTQDKPAEFAGIAHSGSITLGFSDKRLRRALWLIQAFHQVMYLFGQRARSPVSLFRLLNGNALKVSPPCMMVYSFRRGRFESDTPVTLEEVHAVAILEVKEAAAK